MPPTGSTPVPIELAPDARPSSQARQRSGLAAPSGEVDTQGPQAARRDVELSAQPTEELPVDAQPIPPEYRSVFERLQTTTPQAEGAP